MDLLVGSSQGSGFVRQTLASSSGYRDQLFQQLPDDIRRRQAGWQTGLQAFRLGCEEVCFSGLGAC